MHRIVRVVGASALVAGASLFGLAAANAQAATLGPVTITPSAGSVEDTLSLTTSRGCPASASSSKARILGPGFPKFGQNLSGVALGNTSKTKPFAVDSTYTLRDTAALTYPPVTFKGTYRVEVVCISPSKGEVGSFATTLTFVDAVHWKATSATAPVKVGPTASVPPIGQSPSPAGASTTAASPSPSTSSSASSSAGSSSGAPSSSSTDATSGPDALGASAASADASSTPSWLPLVGGVVLGGAVVGGSMVLMQRRQSAGGARGSH